MLNKSVDELALLINKEIGSGRKIKNVYLDYRINIGLRLPKSISRQVFDDYPNERVKIVYNDKSSRIACVLIGRYISPFDLIRFIRSPAYFILKKLKGINRVETGTK